MILLGNKFSIADTNCKYWATIGSTKMTISRLETMTSWCNTYVGERYHTWSYRGNGVFSFKNEDDAVVFALVWGAELLGKQK